MSIPFAFPAFLVGILIGMLIIDVSRETDINAGKHNRRLLEICEQELPRNQQCKIIAVPVEK